MSVFDALRGQISAKVIEASGKSAETLRSKLEDILRLRQETLLQGPLWTQIEVYSQAWRLSAPYTPGYLKKKGLGKNSKNMEFYRFNKNLQRALWDRDPFEAFGPPKVRLEFSQSGQTSTSLLVDSRGRVQYRAGSGQRGFAKGYTARSLASVHFQIEYQMLSRVTDVQRANRIIHMIFPEQGRNQMILMMGQNGRRKSRMKARPFISQYLEWYLDMARKDILKEFLT